MLVDEFRWRGLIHDTSDSHLGVILAERKVTLYVGFDPTADSLHIGSLLPILALKRAQQHGHRPIALVGGATGMIGDPSGKSEERNILSPEQLDKNVAGIRTQLERFLDFSDGRALLVNNYDWLKRFGYLEFLREIGKLFSVSMMLGKESVRSRLEKEVGISYTEFSYMLLQAYDFHHLHKTYDCELQLGGSDQWGNIAAGIDLIHRLEQKRAFGLTWPLATTASGQKFGKTEKGAVWLDANRTSPFELYQFFVNTDDRDVGRFLRVYTLLDEPAILALEETLRSAPQKREAARVLARQVTALVHGEAEAGKAERGAEALFGAKELPVEDLPHSDRPRALLDAGMLVVDELVAAQLCTSKSDARRAIEQGGVTVNGKRVESVARVLAPTDLSEQGFILLSKGKKSKHVLRFT